MVPTARLHATVRVYSSDVASLLLQLSNHCTLLQPCNQIDSLLNAAAHHPSFSDLLHLPHKSQGIFQFSKWPDS